MQPDPALQRLIERVRDAGARGTALDIQGGGTKRFYGEPPVGEPFDVTPLAGISCYDPSELVVTARAGTPLVELEEALAEQGQCLAFEPPRFAANGTVGGMVAAGLAGPARASVGAVRDYTLGLALLNGAGEVLRFGGQVMKNVAGYDIARLLAGSLGILGVICEVSLKVMPRRPETLTLQFELEEAAMHGFTGALAAQPLPVHATAWCDGVLYLRLAGARAAVAAAAARLGGMVLDPTPAALWWDAVRDQRHPFFHVGAAELARGVRLWRLSLPAGTPRLDLGAAPFVEWGGAQRWFRGDAAPAIVRAAAVSAGGHATMIRAADKSGGVFTPPAGALLRIHREVKRAFDPLRIFNPGRLYADL